MNGTGQGWLGEFRDYISPALPFDERKRQRLVDLDGAPLELTRSEFDILTALLANPRRVLTKAQLARAVWSDSYDTGVEATEADRRSVEVHVANLRRKLGEDASRPRYVETVRGVGYRLV